MNNKKLYRNKKEGMFLGVCAGVSHYFNIDATVVRLSYILITAFTGFIPGIIVYILAALVIPENPS